MTTVIKQRIEPIFLHATPLESVIIPHSRVKRWHRKKAKPKRGNYKPAKAILPEGKYFYKKQFVKFKKERAEERRREGTRRKYRGAKNKEALRLFQLEFPYGRPMAKKEAPKHSQIVDTKVVARLLGRSIRVARAYLTRVRKDLGKPRREWVTLREFCSKTPFKPEDVIPYMD